MPQLNPNPWFMILVISWLTLLLILFPKITSFTLFSNPEQKLLYMKTKSWTWPWS
uniref:ATP synthase complex subunit 8 n=1 Tax=Lepidosiren paradoxus TaxID=7883 RepID=A0A8B6QTH3_LEPPA|nr:ATP synthase subunit 8 [Lepidosiren paradoxa]